jgi:hypothetical protein
VKPQKPIRTRHDEWSKRALALWLGALGDVQIDVRVAGESRRGDVLYTERRTRSRGSAARRRRLGLLGRLARGVVLFELFRNPLGTDELESCVLKVIDLKAQAARAARRAKRKRSSVVGPILCAVTPRMSSAFATTAEATRISEGKPGLYRLAPIWRTVLVVVNELPGGAATMWLRLLGRGAVQDQAVKELLDVSEREPLLEPTLELLVAWQQSLPPPAKMSQDERELKMNLEQIYQRWERKTLDRGRREGKAEGRAEGEAKGKAKGMARGEAKGKAEAVLAVLAARGLVVTAAQRKQVLACTDKAVLATWLRAAVTVPSAKELLTGRAPSRRRAAPQPRSGAERRR